MSYVDETAVVHADATLGEGVKVWHFCHVMAGARIGAGTVLGQNVMVAPNVSIGQSCKIQNNVSVYAGVTLEDDVFCGPSCVFTNVSTPRAFVNRKAEFGRIRVCKGATIGANATIVCPKPGETLTLGAYSFVAAGAVVTRDVAPYALVKGTPARAAGWVSKAGEVLGHDLVCPRTGERYGLNAGQLQRVE